MCNLLLKRYQRLVQRRYYVENGEAAKITAEIHLWLGAIPSPIVSGELQRHFYFLYKCG